MFLAMKETRFAKRITRRLLKSHNAVSGENPNLSKNALYRKVLLHSQQVDSSRVELVLRQAEDSVDLWTTNEAEGFGFRQVVHFIVMSQYREAGHTGSVVSFREIVYSLIPANL